MVDFLATASLIAAAVATGVCAGVFQVYAYAIMPGLRRTDDRTFVAAFQQIDRAIINPLFMLNFFGALMFTGIAAVLHLGDDGQDVFVWAAVAFVLYLAVFVLTIAINVPLNDAIKAAGEPDRIDVTAVRRAFNEEKWVRVNLVRAVLNTAGFACLAWALVEHGAV